jgi:lipopolysaccharide/colanic/teichoic acid biosynthesis glycosyltransferase
VLQGTMSLVGPRPEMARYVALYPPALRETLLAVRPGITDPASLAYRHEGELLAAASDPERLYVEELMPAKLRLSADYLARASFGSDCKLLLRSLRVLMGRGGRDGPGAPAAP